MPKKKKGKKKKKADGADGAEMSVGNQLKAALSEKLALERELALFKERAREAIDDKKQLENQIKELKKDFANEEQAKLEITKDMTRQYKSMQENLMREVNQAHDSIIKLREQLDLSKNNMDSKQRAHQKMIAERDAKIREQKRKMEDMATEFSEMLRQTLEKMKQRIEISNINWENEKGPQMISKLERETAAGMSR